MIPAIGSLYGGPSKIAPALATALARQGMTVDLITTDANGPERLDVPCGVWMEQVGYKIQYFSRVGKSEYKLSFALIQWLWQNVANYDTVHIISNFSFPVLACALACRSRKIPYMINPQGMLEPWALQHKGMKKQGYFRCLERPLVLRGAAVIQALNRREAANIRALKIGPAVVILPNGVVGKETESDQAADVEAFQQRFPSLVGKTLILFLHRVDPKKGLDLLARSFAVVRQRYPLAHVVVAGPDNVGFGERARGFFTDAGLGEDAVTFTGMLEGPLKRGVLAAASVFVLPSYSEGFSMSVLEAMSFGLPCVITEGCNFPEAGEADAAYVVPIAAEPFAEALEKILANPITAKNMGMRAQTLVEEKYTWDQIATDAGDIFAGISRSRRATVYL